MNNFKFCPRESNESLSDYSYRVIRDNIMDFNLAPDDIVNEDVIAERIGTSRTPVHEAVLNLHSEGLVTIKPRKESRISKISISSINEGLFVRSCIEPEVIAQASGNLPPYYIKMLMDNLNEQKKQVGREDIDTDNFFRLDDEFHKIIYTGMQRSRTYDMMKRMVVQFDRIRYLILLSELNTGRNLTIYNEHQNLFNIVAFKSNLDSGLNTFIMKHITCLQPYFETLINLYSSYFSFD